MSWSEIKKVVNSDFTTPLNTRIDSKTTTLSNKIDSQTTTLANKFGLTLVEIGSTSSTTKQYGYDVLIFVSSYNSTNIKITVNGKIFETPRNQTGMLFIPRNTSFKLESNYYESYMIYKLGGAFRKCFENLIANILLKKGGVLA